MTLLPMPILSTELGNEIRPSISPLEREESGMQQRFIYVVQKFPAYKMGMEAT